MNQKLDAPISVDEVKAALFQMHHSKAPGLDVMPYFFFHKFWGIVGADVTRAIISSFQSGKLLKQINYTYVSLIPKVKAPNDLSHFKPISLCNVIFKIASKVVAN